jgi:hypothetical protein
MDVIFLNKTFIKGIDIFQKFSKIMNATEKERKHLTNSIGLL